MNAPLKGLYYMFTIHSFVFSPLAENTYLLYNDLKECIIVDPGCYFPGERKALSDYISSRGITPKYLLNTHCHLDHIFGNQFVIQTYSIPLYVHPDEQVVLENAPLAAQRWNLPFDNYSGPLHFLREGDTVGLGEDMLKVISAPGHSPGHVCFYCEQQDFLIGGDVLFRNSIGRTDLPGGNFDTLINSIRIKLFTLPDKTTVYSGHGEPTTIGFEKKSNPFLKNQ
jgi:hydroxyacylglutathione hydrolase